eukprot:316554-Prorocentrum_minimum.AAC.7
MPRSSRCLAVRFTACASRTPVCTFDSYRKTLKAALYTSITRPPVPTSTPVHLKSRSTKP